MCSSVFGNKPTLQGGEGMEFIATVAAGFSWRSCLLSYSTCGLSFTLEISLSACVCVLTCCQHCVIYSVLCEGPAWQPGCPPSLSIMTKFIIPLSGKWHCCRQGEVGEPISLLAWVMACNNAGERWVIFFSIKCWFCFGTYVFSGFVFILCDTSAPGSPSN